MKFWIVSPSYIAFFGGMRRTRVDRDRAHHPCVVLEVAVARVCDALEERVSVALRVLSHSCPRHNDGNHLFLVCVDEPEAIWMKSCPARSGTLSVSCWIRTTWCGCGLLPRPVEHWYNDAEGYKLCTLRYPITESFRRMGLQEAEVFIPSHDFCTPTLEKYLGRPRKGPTISSSTRGTPNATALIRCQT